MTPKSKKTSNDDVRVALTVILLFAAGLALFSLFSKHKGAHRQPSHAVVQHPEAVEEFPAPVEPKMPVEPKRSIEHEHIYVPPQHEIEAPAPVENIPGSGGKIAFILDDWGQTTANCKYLKEIPEPLAVSILPGLRHTKDVAACAGLYHKLAMLHLPLEALHNYDFYPPNYIIKTDMKPDLASKIVDEDLDQLPTIEGVNNHMGSKATEDRPLMKLIFKKVKKRRLFFIDSVTARNTVCETLADEMRMPFGKRDVFLDNINTRDAITKQIIVLAQKARHRGYAVAIGHDRHLTMQVLKDEIPWLEKQGFEIVSIKDLLKNK
jgi:polysaccharide deacetylase 2 family uncharacterized protein YibQ